MKNEALWSPYVGLWVLYISMLFVQFVIWLTGFGPPGTFATVINWIELVALVLLGMCIKSYKNALRNKQHE